MKKLYILAFMLLFYINLKAQILEEISKQKSPKEYAEENIRKSNYFLLQSDYGSPYSYNGLIYARAVDSLTGLVTSKYKFHIIYFGGGCVADPLLLDYADTVNQLMKLTLQKRNKNDNWYQEYEEDKKRILLQHKVYLDSIFNSEFVQFELPFNFKINKKIYISQLYTLARFMLDNPSMAIQIVVYPPKSHHEQSFYKYKEVENFLVKNFGMERTRFSYAEIKNHNRKKYCIKAKYK